MKLLNISRTTLHNALSNGDGLIYLDIVGCYFYPSQPGLRLNCYRDAVYITGPHPHPFSLERIHASHFVVAHPTHQLILATLHGLLENQP